MEPNDWKKLKAGMKFKWIGQDHYCERSVDLNNGDIIEILKINESGYGDIKNLSNGKIREGWCFPIDMLQMEEYEIPKPHEYSPVLMTGRYKTVGD